MSEEPFILMSLKEDKAKKLTQAISNDTARKILDHLSKIKSATETEISKSLELPISTIHYNLQNLAKANLVETEEFHYSEKGKEVLHYSLANKLIIIAPKETSNLKERLKKFLPLGIFAIGATFVINLVKKSTSKFGSTLTSENAVSPMARTLSDAAPVAKDMAQEAMPMAILAAEETADDAIVGAAPVVEQCVKTICDPNIALWFLIGATSIILLLLILEVVRKK